MLESILSSSGDTITLSNVIIILVAAIILGISISLIYIQTHKKQGYAESFPLTIVMLPVIISIIILLVGNNVARAFSLAGAFSIIRFRSEPGDPKDISYIFFTLAVGLALGMGYVGYSILFTIVLCGVMYVLECVEFGVNKCNSMQLNIIIPEDLNFDNVFDEILDKNTHDWKLMKVRTRDFGSLYELSYKINLKDGINQKEFIDELRVKNGNLNITLTTSTEEKWGK